ncbi:MAG TPA: hypothetical protein PKL78_13920 [Anaerolineales bacterium]|nr:hypothetical protein [Anaerolineales bacterium]HNO30551.1 hypothetical protein [Anaerolineales bacterium]
MKNTDKGWFWFLVIVALIAIDQFIFTYFFKISYFEWYRKNGTLIGAVFALVSLTWEINKNFGLVSANPRHYIGAIYQLIGAQITAFGSVGNLKDRKVQEGVEYIFFDNLVFFIFILMIILLNTFWLVLIAPLQYFFVLLFGGPARIYLSAPCKVIIRFEGTKLNHKEIPREDETPKGWMDISITSKPVTLTYGIITLTLFAVGYFL